MRYTRLRLRSSILVILATLSAFFLVTLYTLIWSTNELEREEQNREPLIPPGVVPFWSAINHPNIYDLHATPVNPIFPRSPNITQARIEELNRLIHNARTEKSSSLNSEQPVPIDPSWNFQRLVEQQKQFEQEEAKKQTSEAPNDELNSDTANQTTKTTTTTRKRKSDSPALLMPISEHDKLQLRGYIHRVLAEWKQKHHKDKITTIAEVMRDDLLQEEPSYVFILSIYIH
jgi:hypothetical protein